MLNETNDNSLRECPFCGYEGNKVEGTPGMYEILCEGCDHASFSYFHTEWLAANAWNRRTPPPQAAPQGDVPVASIVYLLGDDYVPSNPMWGTLDAEQKQHLFAIHAWLATQRPTAGEGDALA